MIPIVRGFVCPICISSIRVTEIQMVPDGLPLGDSLFRIETTVQHRGLMSEQCVKFFRHFVNELKTDQNSSITRATQNLMGEFVDSDSQGIHG